MAFNGDTVAQTIWPVFRPEEEVRAEAATVTTSLLGDCSPPRAAVGTDTAAALSTAMRFNTAAAFTTVATFHAVATRSNS